MRDLIIGFSKPVGSFKLFSRLIRFVEKTPFSHVYVKARSESLGVDLIYQASGLQVNFMGVQYFDLYEIPIQEFRVQLGDDEYRRFMVWAIDNAGAPYSLKQALGILLVRLFNLRKNPLSADKKAWVCSELAGYVLSEFAKTEISNSELDVAGPKAIFDICQKYLKPIEAKA